ncbi:MAG TPA: hypothetical protein VFT99_23590, partial [Roseiflexaceae bacterium]|nr:hypothetical protein [Roseiflexaceae bacterium]
ANSTGGIASDINDSDGLEVAGFDQVTLTVGRAGDNNHTYDFGFSPAPTAITLEAFLAQHTAAGVNVTWITGSELNTFGFNLYRGTLADGSDAVQVNGVLITARGRGQGATYQYMDSAARQGVTYFYWLEEVETSGVRQRYGPTRTANGPSGQPVYYYAYLPLVLRAP